MKTLFTSLILITSLASFGQNAALPLQAEDATLGSDYSTVTDGDVIFVTPSTDFANTNFPATADKVITFNITFTNAGNYELYARVRVGSGGAVDDSFYFGSTFGTKAVDVADDWYTVNNIGGNGTSAAADYVSSAGVSGAEVWKWINLSELINADNPVSFSVEAGSLTQTIQLGARENGLDIDMIAFGNASLFYTVSNLMNGEEGVTELPDVIVDPNKTDPIATGESKYLGSAYSNAQSSQFNWHWNQVTPENGGKWASVEGTRDQMNWGGLDAAYNEARDNGFAFKFHVLFWGNQQPNWLPDLSEAEQLEEIHEWLAAIAERYPDIEAIEVVNEPLHDPPFAGGNNEGTTGFGGYGDALGGTGTTGWDWIITAFTLARQYFPNAELMLNDYGIINSNGNITDYLEIVELLKADNLIDVLGVQGHAFTVNTLSTSQVTNSLDALAASGLPLYITELDIDGAGENGDATQLDRYQKIFPAMWEHESVAGITMWGYNPGHWRPDAILVNNDGSFRPAFTWLRSYVEGTEGLKITAPSPSVDAEQTLQLTATSYIDQTSLTDIEWTIENETGSAEIDANGLLIGVSAGTVTVIASTTDGSNVSGTISITINTAVLGIGSDLPSLSLYPNPVSNGVIKFVNEDNIHSVKLINLDGSIVSEINNVNRRNLEMTVDVKSGIYVVQLFDMSGVHTRRIVVK